MKKFLVLLGVLSLFFTACEQPEEETPDRTAQKIAEYKGSFEGRTYTAEGYFGDDVQIVFEENSIIISGKDLNNVTFDGKPSEFNPAEDWLFGDEVNALNKKYCSDETLRTGGG